MTRRSSLLAPFAAVTFACSSVVLLSSEEQAEALAAAIDVPNGEHVPGPPPQEHIDEDHPQIRHLVAPAFLQSGQSFVVHIQSDVEDPMTVGGAALVVKGAPGYIKVDELPEARSVRRPGGLWWAIDLPASMGRDTSKATDDSFELSVALLDVEGEAGNYYGWTVWMGGDGPSCPQDVACGTQECGIDPVCGMPCGEMMGACAAGSVCEFFGSCIDPSAPQDPACLAACDETMRFCGPHPDLIDCQCGMCPPGVECTEQGQCDLTMCTDATDCQAHETCMGELCVPIACDPEPCPPMTQCINGACASGCSAENPTSCPPGSNCEPDSGGCTPLACDPEEPFGCPFNSFCEEASLQCVAHECDLLNPLSCPNEEVCRLVIDFSDGDPVVMPAICQPQGNRIVGDECASNPDDGSHDCAGPSVCWNPEPNGMGGASTCYEGCAGPDYNGCGGAGKICDPVVPGLIHLCADTCDPLAPPMCPHPEQVCVPSQHTLDGVANHPAFPINGSAFVCLPFSGSVPLGMGAACDESSDCGYGLHCSEDPGVAGYCETGRCCVPYCETAADCGPDFTDCSAPLGVASQPMIGSCINPA